MKKATIVIGYLFSISALGMFIYVTFFSGVKELQTQGIYWFGISILCLLLPEINKLKFKDIELEFKQKLAKVEKQIVELEDNFFRYIAPLKNEENNLPKEFVEKRNQHWDNFDNYVQGLDEKTQIEVQKLNSVHYLKEYQLSVKELKKQLSHLGVYKGKLDDNFTQDLANALIEFQKTNNLRHIDGVFGPLTYEKMAEKQRDLLSNKQK